MAGKLVKRTLDIIKSGVDAKVKDYTSNWTQFTSDAREVKDILIKGETNAADTVQKLKRTGITKKISDWFYGAETEFDASGSDSDFDPGFSVESSSDGKLDGDKSSSALTYDSMKDLSAKQTGMMVKIGRRQTEQSVANTAEVISTINNRTAEMVAVMNNINTSLKGVNDRLDKLIKIQSLGIEAEEERALGGESGLYDSNGMLSLKGVFDAARTTGSGKVGQALQTLGMAKGQIGPEMLFSFALDTVLGRPMSSLGGKSINERGKEFNEFIGNSIQSALTNVISSKTFKDLFGDITSFEADKNYGDLRNARYDTKRAQFDNMTRHSIVKIMPELLIKLNENLSGKSYHINQNGDIVEGPAKNYFNEAINSSIGSVNITSRAYSNINQGMRQVFNKEIPKEDIDAAADALLRYYVDYGHRKGSIITKDDIRNASPEAIGTVCDIIGMTNTDSSKGYNYWSKVCQTILYKVTNGNSFDAHAFVNSINQSIRNTQSAAAEQARGFYGDQAGKITLDILKSGYVEKYGSEAQKNQISRSTTTTASKFTTADYVKGIFALLNRGINVKLEGKGTYRKLTEADVKKEPWVIQSTNDEAAARLFGALTGDKNAIKGSMESAMGLLGAANDATGGRVGILQTAANLTTMFNQGKGFFDNIRNKQLTQNLVTALHGDASALKTQVGGKIDQAKNAVVNNLPYGMTHDQRMIDMANSVRGIGNNMLQHGANALNAGRQKFQNQNTVSGPGRLANNLMYNMDTRALNKATNRVMNFSTNGLNDHDVQWFNDAKGLMESQDYWNARDIVDNMHDDKARNYLLNQIDKVTNITQNRMLGESKLAKGERPDIGAVRMAAPDKKNDVNNPKSGLYKLIKGGFNLTTTILKGLFKLAASGASDVFYGMKSFGWGMFGGKNEDGSRHHGLIENLTFDFARGARNLGVGSLKKLAGKVRDKWDAGDSGHYKNQRTNDDGSIDFINYTRGEWRDKQKAEGQDLKSRLKRKEFGTNMSVWDALTHPIKAIATTFKDAAEPIRKFTKTVVAGAKSIAGSIADWVKETKLGRAAGWLGNKASGLFTASEFGKGFTKAWREKSEAKKAKQFDAQREESFINSATGKLMDMISGKDSSMLTQLADILKKIELNTLPEEERRNRLGQQNDQQGTDEEGKGEGDAEGDEDENKGKGKGKGIFGKIKGFFGKKKKNEDPNGSDSAGEGEGGNGTEGEGTVGVPDDGGNAGKATKPPGGEGAADGAGSAGKGFGALSGNAGAILGGIFKSVGGIFKMATSVVLAMEGLETIKTLVTDIFKKGLKPLNQVFQKVYHMIKPLATQLTNIVKEIATALTQMLDGVLKTLTPLLKMISDAISTIFDTVLKPVMEILDATLSACMVPITLCLDAMKPALDIICNDLKIVSGVVQMGMGGIMGLLGGIGKGIGFLVSGVGHILKKFSRKAGKKLVNTGNDVSDAADNMLENAKTLMVNGAKQFKEGLAGQLTVVKKLVTLEYLDDEEEKKETVIDEERANKVNLSDAGANFGSGDVNNYNTWNYTYGSGNTMNQHTYGPTMNMAERGCGPVALADAYMRRTGSGMNPLTLAGAMMGNGSYEPNRGTSVASMVNTGRALGMNMQLGGVTQRSLNGASPNHPITIMGSGSGFGTKRGNDHYLNVVGSDGRGNSYVSNPLTGRVSRTPTSQLALNSRLGLYGSGDKLPDEFGIDLDSMTALERLQSLSERFQKIFTGDSTVDKTKKEIAAGKSANMANTLDAQLGDITKEELETLREKAKDDYFKHNKFRAQRDGESDKEYEAALDAEFDKNGVDYFNEYKKNYIYERSEKYKKSADTNNFEKSWDEMNKNYNKAKAVIGDDSISDDIESEGGSSSSGGNGTFTSENGVPLFNYGTPKYTDINMHDYIDAGSHKSGHSPLHDFFSQTNDGVVAWSYDGNWFKQRYIPDEVGQGTDGKPNHGGIDINWGGQESLGKKALATTGGTVIAVAGNAKEGDRNANNGCGNNVQWIDTDGKIHWYMHLRDNPEVKKDDKIEAGQLLGYVGNTGDSDGAHLHYTITTDNTSSSDLIGEINPITYFAHFNSTSQMVGDNILEHMWSYLRMQGYTPEAIAGYLGFIKGESGHRTEALHGDWNWGNNQTAQDLGLKMRKGNKEYLENVEEYIRAVYGSDNSNLNDSNKKPYVDMGLAQWVGEGGAKLIRDTDAANVAWTNEEMQIKHLDWWLSGIKDKLNNAKSLEDAFHIGGSHNAHPSSLVWTTSDESRFGERLNWAKEIYNKYRNADISTWTGYQDAHTKTNTLPDSLSRSEGAINGRDGKTHDIRIKKYRQDYYVALYQDSVSQNVVGPNADEARSHTYFVTHLNAALGPFLSIDTTELVTNDIVLQYVEKFHANPSIRDGASQAAYYKNLAETYKGKFGSSPYMWAAIVSPTWRFSDEYGEYDGGSDEVSNNMKRTGTVQTETDNLNFRTEPNLKASLVDGNLTIPSGTALNIEDAGVDGWYKTTYAGKTGYVSSDYIKTIADAAVDPADYQVNLYSTFSNYTNWKNGTIFDDSTTRKNMSSSKGAQLQSIGLSYNTNQILDLFTSKKSRDPHISDLFMIKPDIQNALPFKNLTNLWNSESKHNKDYNYDGWIGFPDDRYPLLNAIDKGKYGIYDEGRDLVNTPYDSTFDESDPFYKAWGDKDKYDDDNAREVVNRMLNWMAYDGGGIGNPVNSITFNSPDLYDIYGNEYAQSRSITYKKGDDGKWIMKPDSSATVHHAAGTVPVYRAAGAVMSGSGDVSPEVPAVDMSQLFDETSQTMRNATNAFNGGGATVVVARDDQSTNDMIARLSEITFKVRNERVEELLEEIVDYIKSPKKKASSTFNHVHGSNNYTIEDMFEDEIPEAVMRLSKGG